MSPRATGSNRARGVATRLLRWYPRPWRVRYQHEMQALLDQMPVGWSQVADIAGAAAREWISLRALGWPARSAAGRVQTRRLWMFVGFAFLLDGVARIIAARLVDAHFTFSDQLENIISMTMFLPLLRVAMALVFGHVTAMRRFGNRHPWLKHLSDWEVVAWTMWYLPLMVMRHVLPIPSYYGSTMRMLKPYENLYLVWLFTFVLWQHAERTIRIRKIHTAFRYGRKALPPRTPELPL